MPTPGVTQIYVLKVGFRSSVSIKVGFPSSVPNFIFSFFFFNNGAGKYLNPLFLYELMQKACRLYSKPVPIYISIWLQPPYVPFSQHRVQKPKSEDRERETTMACNWSAENATRAYLNTMKMVRFTNTLLFSIFMCLITTTKTAGKLFSKGLFGKRYEKHAAV